MNATADNKKFTDQIADFTVHMQYQYPTSPFKKISKSIRLYTPYSGALRETMEKFGRRRDKTFVATRKPRNMSGKSVKTIAVFVHSWFLDYIVTSLILNI